MCLSGCKVINLLSRNTTQAFIKTFSLYKNFKASLYGKNFSALTNLKTECFSILCIEFQENKEIVLSLHQMHNIQHQILTLMQILEWIIIYTRQFQSSILFSINPTLCDIQGLIEI